MIVEKQQPNKEPKLSEQRRAFWDSLHGWIRNHGGAIVSAPYLSPVRIELPIEKAMVAHKLQDLGYCLVDRGNESRIGGTQPYYTVRVYELPLPR